MKNTYRIVPALLVVLCAASSAEAKWVCIKKGAEIPVPGLDVGDKRKNCERKNGDWTEKKEAEPVAEKTVLPVTPQAEAPAPAPTQESGRGGGW